MLFQPPQSAKATVLFGTEHELQCMLDVEAALARAEARCGIISNAAAEAIASHCRADLFDIPALSAASTRSGNAAIPLVAQLTRLVSAASSEAAGGVHWGATSQDIIDTGLVLQLRELLALMEETLVQLSDILAALIEKYADTAMAGRTWMQHAVPVTFGVKLAGVLDAVLRHRERLIQLRPRVLVLQFGGAAGTLASLGNRGPEVTLALAAELKLAAPASPWHAHRDRIVELAAFCVLVMTTVSKLARDLALLSQTEIAEVAEPHADGAGGSSSMPHKRNPVALASILTAAMQVPGLIAIIHVAAFSQEHERALGGWAAEWAELPVLCITTQSALETLVKVLDGLTVDTVAMRNNLGKSGGILLAEAVSMALAERLGKQEAHHLVQQLTVRAAETGMTFRAVVIEDATIQQHLSAANLTDLLDPANYLGSTQHIIQSVLAAYRAKGGR
jgi:3-carboxy-cis,cis-muconate cycloisomerase